MAFNGYYQSELTALRELGKRFAERNPALAPFLGQAGRDPDVERLLEGFAFLTGRLRQKLDDELPELTHSLMQLLWPNYMRPLPAFSTLQFAPLARPGPALAVARGTEVEAKAIEGTHCRFRTCYPIELLPLAMTGLDYSVNGNGALLSLRLKLTAGSHLGELDLARLRLHLAGERYISQMLYLALLHDLEGIELALLNASGQPLHGSPAHPGAGLQLKPECLQPVGFAEEEALIPYPLNTFRGYRHLQEYFAFQEKYLFIDLLGLTAINTLPRALLEQAQGLELRFNIQKASARHIRPTLDNVRLYCTPIVNLFQHDANPVRLDGKADRYLISPAGTDASHCGVYSVDRVTGWKEGCLGYDHYVPFESFEHDPSFDVPAARPHYSVRQQTSMLGDGVETWLSFGPRDVGQHETISIELTCTNQNLASRLALGDICRRNEHTPEFLSFSNISAVTPCYAPPLHRDFLWKLISNMSLNYLSLANIEALKVILETYDFPRYYDQHAERINKRLLDGLQAISHRHVDRLHRGLPVRGVRTELIMNPQGYLGEGDLFVFASVLNEFFALYASLNSYHELHVRTTLGELYTWTPRMGQQPLL
ncbi:type VI secretion system baseplate subunit TssF [Pseudomonas typographi]|uniref:type VI secretion system baseplate subunit TssF n=1 Tax=Pseudomonas typographi TaxID=2715964 RepID=UPI0016877E20|nr:type VI secretion system baseplate subunit TssF [Pseudomonas typographi]MBD1553194.1 type VI secretion system baseplate subunit TssF [Pseudomonas typographi]MBD1588074.1 type VI secretion system baseplate subunit TssF [Pseudomonas typographi]